MNQLLSPPILVVLAAALVAAVTDIRQFKIYNVLTLPLIATGLAYHAVFLGWDGLLQSCAGACVGALVPFILYILGGMGAGDVKLLAGIGAWVGGPAAAFIVAVSSIAAGVYALFLIVRYGRVRQTLTNFRVMFYQVRALSAHIGPEERTESLVERPDVRTRLIPFGAMVAIAVIAWTLR